MIVALKKRKPKPHTNAPGAGADSHVAPGGGHYEENEHPRGPGGRFADKPGEENPNPEHHGSTGPVHAGKPEHSSHGGAKTILQDLNGASYKKVRQSGADWVNGKKPENAKAWDALYSETQSRLKAQDIKGIVCYRGISVPKGHAIEAAVVSGKIKAGDSIDAKGLTLTSWTGKREKAAVHGSDVSLVLQRKVPAQDVVASHLTHEGMKGHLVKSDGKATVKVESIHNPGEAHSGVEAHGEEAVQSAARNHFIRSTSEQAAKKWKYHGTVSVSEAKGPEFVSGGMKFETAANCHLESGHVTMFSSSIQKGATENEIKGLAAHEMMHGSYETVFKQFKAEEKRGFAGETEGLHTYCKLYDTLGEDGRKKLESDDGVTDYSKTYWKDYAEGKNTFHMAVHETLAEIAAVHEKTGIVPGSPFYQKFYKAVLSEYHVLSGNKQRPKKSTDESVLGEPEFTDSTLFFDKDWQHVENADDAHYVSQWTKDGTHSVFIVQESE